MSKNLFGRHVVRRANAYADFGERPTRGHNRVDPRLDTTRVRRHVSAKLLGEAEVHHLDPALSRQHYVSGLQITVNDPLPVRGFERLGDFTGDAERLRRRYPSHREGFVQRLTDDMFHDDEYAEVVVADLENLADERVIERGGSQRFATKPLACRRVMS